MNGTRDSRPTGFPDAPQILGHRRAGSEHDLIFLARRAQIGGKLPKIRIDCGTDDFLLPTIANLSQTLTDMKIPHQYEEYPGNHDWEYWDITSARLWNFTRACWASRKCEGRIHDASGQNIFGDCRRFMSRLAAIFAGACNRARYQAPATQPIRCPPARIGGRPWPLGLHHHRFRGPAAFIPRTDHVTVYDADTLAVVGVFPPPRVYTVSRQPRYQCGFTSNGSDSSITMFDRQDAQAHHQNQSDGRPDGILLTRSPIACFPSATGARMSR